MLAVCLRCGDVVDVRPFGAALSCSRCNGPVPYWAVIQETDEEK